MNKKTLRSGDILSSIIFILLGAAISLYSLQLIRTNPDSEQRIYISAGFIPLIFGILLILTSSIVLINGVREGGKLSIFKPSVVWNIAKSPAGLNTLFIYGWIAFYVFVLLRLLPYFISTLLFMIVFMLRFYSKRPALILIVSAVVSFLTTFLFGTVVNIPLPGM